VFPDSPDELGVGLPDGLSLLVEGLPPADRVLNLQLQPRAALLVEAVLVLDLVLVRLGVEGPAVNSTNQCFRRFSPISGVNSMNQCLLRFSPISGGQLNESLFLPIFTKFWH
jgi:hypothetical protein